MTNSLRPSWDAARQAWRALVAADAEQVPRVREPEPPRDHYQPVAERFRAGIRPALEIPVMLELALPQDTWLDIGAGGGRLAVPLAAHVARVVAVEPSPAMRSVLEAALTEAGRTNVEVRDCRWPDAGWGEPVDVAFAAHSLYDIAEIEAFLEAMERHSRRLCIAMLRPWARGTALASLFEAVHGEPMQTLPGLREFVALIAARGRAFEVRLAPAEPEPELTPRDAAFVEARRLLWLAEGSAKDERMRALMEERWGRPDGIALPRAPEHIGVVAWRPVR